MATETLNTPTHLDDIAQHDPRYFVMLHNAVAIKDDKRFEGGQSADAIAYYHDLLNLQLDNCPVTLHLPESYIQAVHHGFDNLREMSQFLERTFGDSDLTDDNSINKLISKIEQHAQKTGTCYLPSGYSNKSGGHYVSLKIRKLDNGHYAFSCLNHGEGMQYHQQLAISGTKIKCNYQSDEYEIDLHSTQGQELLRKLLQLRYDKNRQYDVRNQVNAYSADDLYGLLNLYGNKLPTPDNLQSKAVTGQRTGTCTMTNVNAVAHDILLDQGATPKEYKHYQFVTKLKSLIAGFDAYLNKQYSIEVMQWSLDEFATRINKQFEDVLMPEEVSYCSELQKRIQQQLHEDQQHIIKEKCATRSLPDTIVENITMTNSVDDFKKFNVMSQNNAEVETVTVNIQENTTTKDKITSEPKETAIKPEQVEKLLNFDHPFNFDEIYAVLNRLPHCSGQATDKFWDQLPTQPVNYVTITLARLARIAKELKSSSENSSSHRARHFAVALMLYDIAAQLVPRLEQNPHLSLKLGNDYALGLDDIYSEQYFVTDPVAYHTIKRVIQNFEQRSKNKQRIFTNTVNYADDSYDKTIHYVIRVLLTEEQRNQVGQARMQKDGKTSARYTDEELFEYLVENVDMEYRDPQVFHRVLVLNDTARAAIRLAATTHALGSATQSYQKDKELNMWYFGDHQFHQQLKRRDAQQKAEKSNKNDLEIIKHLPTINNDDATIQHSDFSENTIYHPAAKLKRLQQEYREQDWRSDKFIYSDKLQQFPYQIYPSGALNPSSTVWDVDPKKHLFYEEADQALRHLECAPNLQVVRTLTWATHNSDKLADPAVRLRVHELLFQFGKLDNALANHTQITLKHVQGLLTKLVEYCQTDNFHDSELLIWASHLSHELRYFIEVSATLYQFDISKYQLPDFNPLLVKQLKLNKDPGIRSRLASTLINSYYNINTLSVEQCAELLGARVVANLGINSSLSDEVWQSLQNQLVTTMQKNPNQVTKLLKQQLADYANLTGVQNWQLSGTQLRGKNSDFVIDLVSGALVTGDNEVLRDGTQQIITSEKALFDKLGLNQKNITLLADKDQKHIKSSDGRWEFEGNKYVDYKYEVKFDITRTQQISKVADITSKFTLLKDAKAVKEFFGDEINPFEASDQANTHYQYWQSDVNKQLLLVQQTKTDHAYSYTKQGEVILLHLHYYRDNQWDIEALKEFVKQHDYAKILIKATDTNDACKDISFFGFIENRWQLVHLDVNNQDVVDALSQVQFNASATHVEMLAITSDYTQCSLKKLPAIIHEQLAAHSINVKNTNTLNQLMLDQHNAWHQTSKWMLNLIEPTNVWEQNWQQFLTPMFGQHNIRCIAAHNSQTNQAQLESIEHLSLKLNFHSNEQRQLMCEQFPEYFLAQQASLPALNGLATLITLVNNKGQKKYILPAFELAAGDKNNALDYDNIINYEKLCNPEQPYYTYSLNKHNQLVGDSVEANLYLALLHRSQGNFKQALQTLERCKTRNNINSKVVNLALQVFKRKMISPMAAAFDLKLQCYLIEHQQKWTTKKEDKFDEIKFSTEWDKHIQEQQQFYNNTVSGYKQDIAILPSYCRLTEHELTLLTPPEQENKQSMYLEPESSQQQKNRLNALADYNQLFKLNTSTWSRHIDNLANESKIDFKDLPYDIAGIRFYALNNQEPTWNYLVCRFDTMLKDAISSDAKRVNQLHKTLFTLLQNDSDIKPKSMQLVALLNFASKRPELYQSMQYSSGSLFDPIKQAGEIFFEHKDSLSMQDRYLVNLNRSETQSLSQQSPLASNFIASDIMYQIPESNYQTVCQYPLRGMRQAFFSQSMQSIAKVDFALEWPENKKSNLLEQALLSKYKKGHHLNQQKTKPIYKPKTNAELVELKAKLLEVKQHDQAIINQLELLLAKANATPLDKKDATLEQQAQAHNLLQARASGQKHLITVSDLFNALLQQDPALLTAQNPFLQQADIDDLFANLIDYALLNSRIDQVDQALAIANQYNQVDDMPPYQLQLLAETLDKPRAYDIKQYPEFLIYEYATKRILREDQVAILCKIINLIESPVTDPNDMHHALLQFAAGGGKSSVLTPILARRFAAKGLLPVIFNTNELYQIGLEDIPKHLHDSFQQNMEVIERDLEHQWTEQELKKLLKDLQQWRAEKKCILIKPVTWHALNITKKLAFTGAKRQGNNKEILTAAQNVLNFFQEHAVKLEDESHIISDPLQQSIKTYGKMLKIPEDQLALLRRCYDALMGIDHKADAIAKLANLRSQRERAINPTELKALQQQLAYFIAQEPQFKSLVADDIVAYLLQDDTTRPAWLKKIYGNEDEMLAMLSLQEQNEYWMTDREQRPDWLLNKMYGNANNKIDKFTLQQNRKTAELVVLARAFIQTHLPHILTLQLNKDYGASIHAGDLTAAPKHEGKDVTSHFGDHTLVAALTIQLYHQRGLLAEQAEQLINKLLKEHQQERLWNHDMAMPTMAEAWLLEVIPEHYTFHSCQDLTEALKKQLIQDSKFLHHPLVVEKYLTEFALPQIKIPEHRQISTAAELQAGFKRSILLSATPGLTEVYPAFIKPENCFFEETFEAQVIDTLLQQQNQGICVLNKAQTASEFFQQIPDELLHKMTTLIDRGALFTDFDPADVIASYLDLPKEKLITQAGVYFSKESMHLKSITEHLQDTAISGAGLVDALRKQGVDPSKFLLFLFLDLSKTTGTDIKRPFEDHAGLTVGPGQTVTQSIQAAMRERQLLEENAQSITWMMFGELYREIYPNDGENFDPRKVFHWMISNEARELETKIVARAYQGIYQVISDFALRMVEEGSNYSAYDCRYALEQTQSVSPYNLYELETKNYQTEQALSAYAKSLQQAFRLARYGIELPPDEQARIDTIIKQTSALIAELPASPTSPINAEVQQEMQTEMEQEQEQEQEMKTKFDVANDFVFELETYTAHQDSLTAAFDTKLRNPAARYQYLQLPKCNDIKLPELLICPEHFAVTKIKRTNEVSQTLNTIEQLKPIKLLLIKFMPDGRQQYLACTAAGAEYYSFLINNERLSDKQPRYALVTTDGDILQTSNNLNYDTCQQLIQQDNCQQMLTYTQFLNGQITKPNVLSGLIKALAWTEKQYETVVDAITDVHVASTPLALLNNASLAKLCGWTTTTAQKHLRYQPPRINNQQQAANQPLYKPEILANGMTNSELSILEPKRCLENYLFEVTPAPVTLVSDTAKLLTHLKNIQSMLNDKNVTSSRRQAIQQLQSQAKSIVNSLLTTSEKSDVIAELYRGFKQLDDIAQTTVNKLDKLKIDNEILSSLKSATIKNIDRTYQRLAEGKSLDECSRRLYDEFDSIAREAIEQVKNINKGTFKSFFGFNTGNDLVRILQNGTKQLEKISVTQDKTETKPINLPKVG
ncbi:MAG: hypothetical protein Tsb005_15550 [Gammaproteobacteria bacterium]